MSTRGSIYYKKPVYIYHEMSDDWVYLALDSTPSILIPLCRVEFYRKIKQAAKRFVAWWSNVH